MALAAQEVLAKCLHTTSEQAKAKSDVDSSRKKEDREEELDVKSEQDRRSQPRKKRKKRSSKKAFRGFKERCRVKNRELTEMVMKVQEENQILSERNTALVQRSVMLQRKCALLVKSSTAPRCGTGVTSGLPMSSVPTDYEIASIRHISKLDIVIDKNNVLGSGAFGKCFVAKVGHRDVCAKVFRKGPTYAATFPIEANLLGKCCHENLPWLYGVYGDGPQRAIFMSLHTYQGVPTTIHKLLCDGCAVSYDFGASVWNKLLLGIARGVLYLHNLGILHNDIKGDNVLVEKSVHGICSILTDLGKGCYLRNAKCYSLSHQKKLDYARYHPQIAPDLVNGHCKQSKFSDIYSVGRIVKEINKKILKNPDLEKYSSLCMSYLCTERPASTEYIIDYANGKLT